MDAMDGTSSAVACTGGKLCSICYGACFIETVLHGIALSPLEGALP